MEVGVHQRSCVFSKGQLKHFGKINRTDFRFWMGLNCCCFFFQGRAFQNHMLCHCSIAQVKMPKFISTMSSFSIESIEIGWELVWTQPLNRLIGSVFIYEQYIFVIAFTIVSLKNAYVFFFFSNFLLLDWFKYSISHLPFLLKVVITL